MVNADHALLDGVMQYRSCQHCQTHKPLTAFGKDKNLPGGITLWCKTCRNVRQSANRACRASKSRANLPAAIGKRCPNCGILKSLDEFGRDPARKLGVKSWCSLCASADQRAKYDPAVASERSASYRAVHPQKVKAANDRRMLNPEKYRAQSKKSKLKRVDKVRAYNQDYYLKNRLSELARSVSWQAANPEKVRANLRHQGKVRSARARGAGGKFTRKEWVETLLYFNFRCAYCLLHEDEVGSLHQEHMLPVCRGGSHTKDNIVPGCRSCNTSKMHRTPMEFLAYQLRRSKTATKLAA
jgi:hypothetical protein